jgi:hypothetical protein
MPDMLSDRNGTPVLVCSADGPPVSDRNAVDLVGDALGQGAEAVAIPAERLDERFFTLASGVAGEIAQKFVNYRLRLAIVGDIGEQLAASNALRDFVRETNRGGQLWFVADLSELDGKLAGARR